MLIGWRPLFFSFAYEGYKKDMLRALISFIEKDEEVE